MPLLEIHNLAVEFQTHRGPFRAVDGIDLTLEPGELLGVVGESGSGKSVTMLAVMGLIAWPGKVTADVMRFDGIDLLVPVGPRAAQDRRQGHRDDLPGADDQPQPVLQRRLPDHGDAGGA